MAEIAENEAVLEALRRRQSARRITPRVPPRALVERVIEAATWAPNHHLTRPWRFVVVAGEARRALGDVMATSLRATLSDPDGAGGAALLTKELDKPLRAPVLIAVAAVPSHAPKVVEVEEIAAVAAGVQNMLLAAGALGLGAMWRTGAAAYDPAVKRFLGLPDGAHLLAFVYLGYAEPLPPRERPEDGANQAVWLGWEEPTTP